MLRKEQTVKQLIKKALDVFFLKTVSYRIVHSQMYVESDVDVWKNLKKSGFIPQGLVDVGAAVGSWTSQMLKVFPSSRYLMVDPLDENISSLNVVTDKHTNVQYWMGALGRNVGELCFYVHGDQSSMFNSYWKSEQKLRRVRKSTLDEVVQETGIGVVDGLKLDVQGAELEVLSGASVTLQRCKVIQVEVMFRHVYEGAPLAHDVICFLAEQHFRIYDIASLYKREDHALLQCDLFFVKDDALFVPETWNL